MRLVSIIDFFCVIRGPQWCATRSRTLEPKVMDPPESKRSFACPKQLFKQQAAKVDQM